MTDGADYESEIRAAIGTEHAKHEREAWEHTIPDADAYEKFLAEKPYASPQEFLAFLAERGLNLTESAPAHTGEGLSPITQTLTDDPKERYVINALLNRRFTAMQQKLVEERENGYRPNTPTTGEDIERYYDNIETKFVALFCERVVGLSKAAALLETASFLDDLSNRDAAAEPSLRDKSGKPMPTTLAKLIKKDIYERGEFSKMLQVNRAQLRSEIAKRAAQITNEEARGAFAKAFDVEFETYTELFPEKL